MTEIDTVNKAPVTKPDMATVKRGSSFSIPVAPTPGATSVQFWSTLTDMKLPVRLPKIGCDVYDAAGNVIYSHFATNSAQITCKLD